jgi:hypothetical protein
VWTSETEHYVKLGKSQDEARKIAQKKRERWMSDCQSELRRIDFLREKLAGDTEENHLVVSRFWFSSLLLVGSLNYTLEL